MPRCKCDKCGKEHSNHCMGSPCSLTEGCKGHFWAVFDNSEAQGMYHAGVMQAMRERDTAPEITKQKAGKPNWSLLLQHIPLALREMIKVRANGIKKYEGLAAAAGVPFDSEGWRTNPAADYLESATRHIVALWEGENVNEADGGSHHAAHAMIDLAFYFEILEQEKRDTMPVLWFRNTAPSADVHSSRSDVHPSRTYLWADGGAHLKLNINSPADLPPLAHIVDVMARTKRWGGQCEEALSVALHCVVVARIARELWNAGPDSRTVGGALSLAIEREELERLALTHDAAEALLGDIPTPRKRLERSMLPPGVEHPNDILTKSFDAAMREKLQLSDSPELHAIVKRADMIAGTLEARERSISNAELSFWYPSDVLDCAHQYASCMRPSAGPKDDAAIWWKRMSYAGPVGRALALEACGEQDITPKQRYTPPPCATRGSTRYTLDGKKINE